MLTIRGRLITPFVLGSMSVGLNILIRHSFMDLWFWITALVPWPQLLIDGIICIPRISQVFNSILIHIKIFHYFKQVWLVICSKYAHCINTSIIIDKSWLSKTVLFWSVMRTDSSVIQPFITFLKTGNSNQQQQQQQKKKKKKKKKKKNFPKGFVRNWYNS